MKRAVFLDRDGTIIRDKNYLRSADEIELLSGVVEALKLLKSAGFVLIICTNQSGIARGFLSERQYKRIEKKFVQTLAGAGATIDKTYYCPHLPDAPLKRYAIRCECRKPGKGMFIAAQRDFNLDFRDSFAIGDSLRDLKPAKELGAKTILVLTGKGRGVKTTGTRKFIDFICRDLNSAARKILHLTRGKI